MEETLSICCESEWCQQCSSEFTLKSTLLCHVKTHTNKLNYTCKVCNSSFMSLRILNAHLRKHDFESLPKWQCITCGYLFDEWEQGIKHREKMGREKPHVVQTFINHIIKQPLYQTTYGPLAFKPPKARFPNTGSESPTLRPFHCTICDSRFTRRINLKRHIQFHNGDRSFKCNLCTKTFITSYRLKEHLNFHNNVKNYACKQCDKRFVTSTLLKRHMIIHNNHKPYQCPYCVKTFKTLLLSRTHITKVHKKEVVSKLSLEPENLLAKVEAKDSMTMESLSINSGDAILQNLPPTSDNDNIVIEQLLPEGENCIQIMNPNNSTSDLNYPTIYVNMNELQFLDTSNLNLSNGNIPQLKLENPDSSLINQQENMEVNDIIFDINPLKTTLNLPPEEIFETSTNENQLSNSLPSISEITAKPLKLTGFSEDNVTDKAPNLNALLSNNIGLSSYLNLPITVDEGSANFNTTPSNPVFQTAAAADLSRVDDIYETTNIICISCSRMFVSLDSFQVHACISITEEPDEKRSKELSSDCDNSAENEVVEEIEQETYKCEVCNKMFAHEWTFTRHLGTHSIKSNIVCTICDAVLHGRAQYIKHLAKHKDPKAGSLNRTCKFCFKEFKKPSDLNRHLRTHTGEKPFGCHLCGKSFTLKSTLESHVKTHDPTPKQFSCNVCNSFFSSKSSLKVHMTLHTGQRPHCCSFCDQKFRTVGNRKSHEALMHLSKSKKSGQSKHAAVKNVLESVASGIINDLNEIQPSQDDAVQNNDTEDTSAKIEMEGLSSQAVNPVVTTEINPVVTTETLLSTLQDDPLPIDPVLLLQQLQMSGLVLTNENNEPVSTFLLDDGTILNVDSIKDNIPELSLQPQPVETQPTVNVTEVTETKGVKTEKIRNLECDICHKMYASKDVLRKHRKKVHGVNKKYPCIKCDRAYDTQDELTKHNKWHTGYKAFSCVYCANSFTEESGLKIHMKRMHQHSNATKTTTSALVDVNFDLPPESIGDPLLNNLFTFKKIL